ncbi:MAG TPA: hypothetical protein VK157_03055 [Phycisphaerales bacterium]|nr:hypothetical protein [Phycisphaerales bacterium]
MQRFSAGFATPAALVLAAGACYAQWTPGYRAERLGYFGPAFTAASGEQQSIVRGQSLSRDGLIVGVSYQYAGNDYAGLVGWASSTGGATQRLGFFDAVHTGPTGEQFTELGAAYSGLNVNREGMNALGQVVGYSLRYGADGSNGTSLWLWDQASGTTDIGLRTGVFVGPEGQRESTSFGFNDAGRVIGTSVRYDVDPANLGGAVPTSAWTWTREEGHTIIGLVDARHTRFDGFQSHTARWINDAGIVTGVSLAYPPGADFSDGTDAWVWSPGEPTRKIGPTGLRYNDTSGESVTTPNRATNAGDLIGTSRTFFTEPDGDFSRGTDAWVYPAGSSLSQPPIIIGLTGPEHTDSFGLQNNRVTAYRLDAPLRVSGIASIFFPGTTFPFGRSAWSWAPGEGTIEIGLFTGEHRRSNGGRDNFAVNAFRTGEFIGIADRYGPNDSFVGNSAWLWTPPTAGSPQGTNRRLGLFDALHTSSDGFQRSEIYGWTDSGYAYGVSYRYNGRPSTDIYVGRTIWVFNVNTGVQTNLAFDLSSSNDAIGLPLRMTESGVLTGYYQFYNGNEGLFDPGSGRAAFIWSAERGVSSIDALLTGGLAGQQLTATGFTDFYDDVADVGILYGVPEGVSYDPTTNNYGFSTAYRLVRGSAGCDSIDFNNNTVFPEDQDVIDFFNVLAGGECSTGNTCGDIDFNNNTVFPEDQDVIDFFNVLAGGECP